MSNATEISIPRLVELAGKPWALSRATAEAWRDILTAKLEQGTVNVTEFVAARAERRDARDWDLDNGLAVIPVHGTLIKKPSLFHSGSTYGHVREMVTEALEDREVDAILLDIDSPGGAVDGLTELTGFLAGAAEQKPLYAYADGQAASAAYWIASQAREIAAPPEAEVGSIGVRTVHVDRSEAHKQRGLSVTHLAVGDYKVAGNWDQALDETSRTYLMNHLQGIYDLFADAVAKNRGMDRQAVVDTQARTYLAARAKELGLIDMVMGREKYISHIKESMTMDINELRERHAALVSQVEAEATAGMISQADADTARAEAVKAETDRCMGIVSALMGEDLAAKVTSLLQTGVTADQAKAFTGILGKPGAEGGASTEAGLMSQLLEGIQGAGAEGVKPQPKDANKSEAEGEGRDFESLVKAYREKHGCDLAKAQAAVAAEHPKAHKAYIDNFNKGLEGRED